MGAWMLLGNDFSWDSWKSYIPKHTQIIETRSQGVFHSLRCLWEKNAEPCGERMYLALESPRLGSVTLKFTWFIEFLWGLEVWGWRNFVGRIALFVWLVHKGQCHGTECFQVTWGETYNFFHKLLPSALFLLAIWFRHFIFAETFFPEYQWL